MNLFLGLNPRKLSYKISRSEIRNEQLPLLIVTCSLGQHDINMVDPRLLFHFPKCSSNGGRYRKEDKIELHQYRKV